MIDPQFLLSLISDVENIKGKLSADEKKEIFKKFHITVKTHTSSRQFDQRLLTLMSDDLIKQIAETLHYKSACLHQSFPHTYCGIVESDEKCINCYINTLKSLRNV